MFMFQCVFDQFIATVISFGLTDNKINDYKDTGWSVRLKKREPVSLISFSLDFFPQTKFKQHKRSLTILISFFHLPTWRKAEWQNSGPSLFTTHILQITLYHRSLTLMEMNSIHDASISVPLKYFS